MQKQTILFHGSSLLGDKKRQSLPLTVLADETLITKMLFKVYKKETKLTNTFRSFMNIKCQYAFNSSEG